MIEIEAQMKELEFKIPPVKEFQEAVSIKLEGEGTEGREGEEGS